MCGVVKFDHFMEYYTVRRHSRKWWLWTVSLFMATLPIVAFTKYNTAVIAIRFHTVFLKIYC